MLGPELISLAEQLQQPEALSGEVTVQSRASLYRRGPQKTISEREAVTDYFDFLQRVKHTAEEADEPTVAENADRFMREATYVSTAARQEALTGLMGRQVAFLRENPDRAVSLFVDKQSAEKSQGLLAAEAKTLVNTFAPDVAERLQVSHGLHDSQDGRVKNVLLDDWSVTGNQLSNTVAHALRTVKGPATAPAYKESLEVNLLVIREDQIADNFEALRDVESVYGIERPVPVVGYYRAPGVKQHEGPMPTGTHSSVDYGFESQLAEMRDYLAAHTHQEVDLPYLASVVRTQREW